MPMAEAECTPDPEKARGGKNGVGVCVATERPKYITNLGPYGTECICSEKFVKSKPTGECDVCGFGYRGSYPNCTLATLCKVGGDDCGETKSQGKCTSSGHCSCSKNYFGFRCTEFVPPSVKNSLEMSTKLRMRFSFDNADASNSAPSVGASPDFSVLQCQLPDSLLKCEAVPRAVGKIYRVAPESSLPNRARHTYCLP